MADALTDDEKLRRGRAAAQMLEHELFREAVEDVERESIEAFANSRPADTEAREAAYQRVRGIRAVGEKLRSWVNDAKVIESRRQRA